MERIDNPRTARALIADRNAAWLKRHSEAGPNEKTRVVRQIAQEIGKDARFVWRGIANAKAKQTATQQKTADSR